MAGVWIWVWVWCAWVGGGCRVYPLAMCTRTRPLQYTPPRPPPTLPQHPLPQYSLPQIISLCHMCTPPTSSPRSGILPADHALASWLRTQLGPPGLSNLVLVVNKCERKGRAQTAGVGDVLAEACALGLGEPLALSAHTGEGLVDLYGVLQPRMDALAEEQEENEGREEGEGGGEGGGEEEEEGEQGGEKGRGGDRGLHGNRTADVQSWAESTLHSRKKDNTTSTMHKDSTQRQSELSLEDQVARIIAGCADGVITDAAAAQLEGLDAAVGAAVGGIEGKGRVKMAVMGLPNAVCFGLECLYVANILLVGWCYMLLICCCVLLVCCLYAACMLLVCCLYAVYSGVCQYVSFKHTHTHTCTSA